MKDLIVGVTTVIAGAVIFIVMGALSLLPYIFSFIVALLILKACGIF
jgi:hypothetical protein